MRKFTYICKVNNHFTHKWLCITSYMNIIKKTTIIKHYLLLIKKIKDDEKINYFIVCIGSNGYC